MANWELPSLRRGGVTVAAFFVTAVRPSGHDVAGDQ